MRRFTILLLTVFLATALRSSHAQSLDAFKRTLAAPAAGGVSADACVSVTEFGDAGQVVARAARDNARLRLRGYRVCIYMDNGQSGQDARAGAVAAKTLFEQTYPGIRVYMVYENPYFKVSVGNCLTAEEAIILKGKVSETFPKAFPKHEELSVGDLLN